MRALPVTLLACSFATSLAGEKVLEHRSIEFHYTDEQLQGTAPLLTATKKLSSDGPIRTFKIFRLRSFSNSHYRIEVCSEDGNQTIQQLEIRNGIGIEYYRGGFQILDVDTDGYQDIRLLGGFDNSGHYDKPWYKDWVYQPDTQTFVSKPNKPK
jgi:hypothetical protein